MMKSILFVGVSAAIVLGSVADADAGNSKKRKRVHTGPVYHAPVYNAPTYPAPIAAPQPEKMPEATKRGRIVIDTITTGDGIYATGTVTIGTKPTDSAPPCCPPTAATPAPAASPAAAPTAPPAAT